jgi:hypothetical protein
MAQLRVGFSRAEITPSIGTPLGGYLGRPQFYAIGIHDPLYASAIALEAGTREVLLFSLDLLGLTPERSLALSQAVARAAKLPQEAIVIACTHTHSGPNTLPLRGIPDVAEEYYDYLEERLKQAGLAALRRLRPARLQVGAGKSDVGANRRAPAQNTIQLRENPSGTYDDTLLVLRFVDADFQDPLGLVAIYGCHLTALGASNMLISAEWAGLAMRSLEQEFAHPCVFLNGAFGNVNPRGRDETWQRTEQIAAQFAADCKRALAAATPEPELPLCLVRRTVQLPLAPLAAEEEIHRMLAEANAVLEASPADEISRRLAAVRRAYAQAVQERRISCTWEESRPAELVGLRIGSVALLGMPGEVFAEYAIWLRQGSPFRHTMVLGNVGYELGYLPTAAAFAEGGYEPNSYIFFCEQGFSPAIEGVLLEAGRSILAELATDQC